MVAPEHRLHTSQVSDKIGLHRYVHVQLLLVTAQGRICANRFYHSLGWCEACAPDEKLKPINFQVRNAVGITNDTYV